MWLSERVGVLANMESRPRTLRFPRNGTPLDGLVSARHGYPLAVTHLVRVQGHRVTIFEKTPEEQLSGAGAGIGLQPIGQTFALLCFGESQK